MIIVAVVGPVLVPYPPTAIGVAASQVGPSWSHLLGTDALGRDVLSRVLAGGRSTIEITAITTAVSVGVGAIVGMFSAYLDGLFDIVTTRGVDFLLSLPPLLLVLTFVAALGSSNVVLILMVAVFSAPRDIRVIRGAAQGVSRQDYVLAARARGEGSVAIVFREILPNVTGPLLASACLRFSYVLIFITTLTFLGLGVQPPAPDWGLMVSENSNLLSQQPYALVAPALCIVALCVGVNLIGDRISTYFAQSD
jgi:peptide/nickel transport system permease protein